MYPMINLFYTQLIQRLLLEADNQEEGRLEVPVRIILDDFASNVQIEDFDKIIYSYGVYIIDYFKEKGLI
jgi:type IV secretion system protein VirD4